jgi:hypothetical protein
MPIPPSGVIAQRRPALAARSLPRRVEGHRSGDDDSSMIDCQKLSTRTGGWWISTGCPNNGPSENQFATAPTDVVNNAQMRETAYPILRMTLDHDKNFGGGGLAKAINDGETIKCWRSWRGTSRWSQRACDSGTTRGPVIDNR